MKFGKKFSNLIAHYPQFANLSANRCSKLSVNELRAIAKVLYPHNKDLLYKYICNSKDSLANKVYLALNNVK